MEPDNIRCRDRNMRPMQLFFMCRALPDFGLACGLISMVAAGLETHGLSLILLYKPAY